MRQMSNINIALPTVHDLNQLSCTKNCLVFLRILNTSDLTFMYMLFKPDTLRDIVSVIHNLLNIEGTDAIAELTVEEMAEFNQHLEALEEYIRLHG